MPVLIGAENLDAEYLDADREISLKILLNSVDRIASLIQRCDSSRIIGEKGGKELGLCGANFNRDGKQDSFPVGPRVAGRRVTSDGIQGWSPMRRNLWSDRITTGELWEKEALSE